MNKLFIALAVLALSGCATPIIKVSLHNPITINHETNYTVSDERQDKIIYILTMSYTKSQVFMLSPTPSVEATLNGVINRILSNTEYSPKYKTHISIKRIDLKSKVGYLQPDDLYCEIESKITSAHHGSEVVVKTFSKNNTNMSPAVSKAAKVILQQCIEDHANEISEKIYLNRV